MAFTHSRGFNKWAIEVADDLVNNGVYFTKMTVDGDSVDFGKLLAEGMIALHTTDFALVKMRVDCIKDKRNSTVNI
jgi:hypothetical protein